ncbi:MAG: T9SS type A sorting domain-containing protein [Bacteroidetes bacterium]|nr:T9SS type A sorting domain-containing protein [Bacteroidota bacterium]
MIDPGVTFQPGAGGPWPTMFESDTMVLYGDGGIILRPREKMEGFNACFQFAAGHSRSFRVEWRTEYNNNVVTIDTVLLDCQVQQLACDTVAVQSVTIPQQPDGTCSYDFTLKNLHEPAGELNGLRLVVMTPGAEFVPGFASGPWDIFEETASTITFGASTNALSPGAELDGFRVTVLSPTGTQGNIVLRWISSFNGQIFCEDDVVLNCAPTFKPRKDTLLLRKQQDCSYDIGFINKHVPRSTLNGFRLSVVTPGASFASVTAPAGWTTVSQTGLNVQFSKSGTALATADSVKGFLVTFKASSSGVVRFVWTTTNGTNVATRDTVQIQCTPPPPVVCDSLLVAGLAACRYDFGFVNKHQPTSEVNEFHIRLQNPGATISEAEAPTGWVIDTRTSTDIVFKNTVGSIASGAGLSGFLLTLTPSDVGNTIVFEYCTALDGAVNCCEFSSVECVPPQERCDSLAIAPSPDYCSYSFSLTNQAVPATDIDAWRLRLDDPGAILWTAEAPAGWTLDTLDEQQLRFVKDAGVLSPGETATGFLLSFIPSGSSGIIPFTWTTERSDQDRCSDTASVTCEVKIVSCDVIDVVTSTERPCCFDFSVQNTHLPRGLINGFNVQILTPGVTLWASTIVDPDGWTHINNSTRVGWRRTDGAILPGETLAGFAVCYDNSAIDNADFQILTQTVENGLIICEDTLTIKCDRALSVELLPGSAPGSYRLHQNFPNPFNPTTTIMFDLPERSDVTLSLYDTHGRLVLDLGSGEYEAGSWQITLDASALTSGTYHYQIRTPEFSATRSLILLK